MLKRIFTILFLVASSLIILNPTTQARELDMEWVQKTLKENSPITTEINAVHIMIVYTELMSYLSTDLAHSMATDVKAQLPNIKYQINRARDSRDREVLELLEEIKSKLVVLVEGVNQNNAGVKNLAEQVLALNKSKEQFPEAKFVPTLDLLVNLTKEFSVDYENFTIELNRYVMQMTEIQKRIEKKSSKTAKSIEELAQTELSIEKHSFSEIGSRFQSIGSVLRMMYDLDTTP